MPHAVTWHHEVSAGRLEHVLLTLRGRLLSLLYKLLQPLLALSSTHLGCSGGWLLLTLQTAASFGQQRLNDLLSL